MNDVVLGFEMQEEATLICFAEIVKHPEDVEPKRYHSCNQIMVTYGGVVDLADEKTEALIGW